VVLRGVGLALAVVALAGCGGGSKKACPAVQKLDRELAAMQTAKTSAEAGRLTDRFLVDVETAPIDNIARNRLIDHAAAAVSSLCHSCFEALEADRPVITIRFRKNGAARGVACDAD
jgi:hypothetical protein